MPHVKISHHICNTRNNPKEIKKFKEPKRRQINSWTNPEVQESQSLYTNKRPADSEANPEVE